MPYLPEDATPEQVVEAYNQGMQGWIWNLQVEREWEQFWSGQQSLYSQAPQLKDSHKDPDKQRVLLYRYREQYDPGAFSMEAQTTGDCVSHGDRNARDSSRCVEMAIKNAEFSYYRRGATETTYAMRGHSGEGMDPARAAQIVTKYGWLFRENYPDLGFDLTKYNSSIGSNFGRSGLPQKVLDYMQKHYNVGSSARPDTVEETLDLMANGHSGHSGQSWGTSSSQPADGINRGPGPRWGHDMSHQGYDLTQEFFKSDPVAFVPNQWGAWNKPNKIWLANQDVYGPWIPGMIVISLDEYERYFVKSGSIHFYSAVKGFPQQTLPPFKTGIL